MPLQPVMMNGQVRLLQVEVGGQARDEWAALQENERRAEVWKRRLYYAGEQYLEENRETAEALGIDWLTGRLPEHQRKHAYSTQISESVDFLADQMMQRFAVEAEAVNVQEVLDAALEGFPLLAVIRDALIAGDVAMKVGWNPVTAAPQLFVYESESVLCQFADDNKDRLEKVTTEEIVWRDGPSPQVVLRHVWEMVDDVAMEFVYEDDELISEEPAEFGLIPWCLLRGDSRSLSASRGESVITFQGMQCSDRYNAVEQVGWLIARYNSHGNLAVIGDAASLKAQQEERIEKDVADVLTFPGGTAITTITLPTDVQMITHQRVVLLDALYATFGLTRIDQETVSGYGNLSGYALEILNRKTDGTFDRLRKSFAGDFQMLVDLILDVTSNQTGVEFPLRDVDVRFGGVYVVDDVQVRDDFAAGLISREEALRKRGYSDDDIEKIVAEIEDSAPPVAEVGQFGMGDLLAAAAAPVVEPVVDESVDVPAVESVPVDEEPLL